MPKTCRDHKAQEFPSVRAMLANYGISRKLYYGRLERGWSLEQTLTTPPPGVKDHHDNEYATETAMCRAYGISLQTLRERLSKGMTLEQALTTKPSQYRSDIKDRTDHKGKVHKSTRAMCRAWNVQLSTYRSRIRSGMSVEQALTTKTGVIGPDGKTYRSKQALYDAFHVTSGMVTYRQSKKNTSLNDSILDAAAAQTEIKYAHNGVEYDTLDEMCASAGIKTVTYLSRINAGWSKERALSQPVNARAPVQDIFQNEYPTIMAMCAAWRCTDMIYRNQVRMSGRDAALQKIAIRRWPGAAAGGLRIKTCIAFPWFLCEDQSQNQVIIHASQLLEKY